MAALAEWTPLASPAPVGPLASWFPESTALECFHRRWLGRSPRVLFPRDRAWAGVVPGFEDALSLPASGVPFQTVLDRRYDRSGDPRRFRRALAAGRTVYFPQAHQVLPRLMRLMVALRVAFLGPFRDECSFLFLAAGRGRVATTDWRVLAELKIGTLVECTLHTGRTHQIRVFVTVLAVSPVTRNVELKIIVLIGGT